MEKRQAARQNEQKHDPLAGYDPSYIQKIKGGLNSPPQERKIGQQEETDLMLNKVKLNYEKI